MPKQTRLWRLDEIAARLGGDVLGDPATAVTQVAPIERARPGTITFLSSPKLQSALQSTLASAVVLAPATAAATSLPRIVVANPYLYYARLVGLLNPEPVPPPGAHPTAVVGSPLPASASVGAHTVIGSDVVIGENVRIGAGCVIGDGASIGDGSQLHANVTLYADCRVGARALIHSGVVVGSDGFGFAKDGEHWIKIPQIGRVLIGDDVEIGGNTTIDRGALEDTVIGNGVKLDNLIHIAHNIRIGDYTAIAACVGIAGSTTIGSRCTVGGAAMIVGHIDIADDVHISGGTVVAKSIQQPGRYTGIFPMEDHAGWLRNTSHVRHLNEMHKRLRELEKQHVATPPEGPGGP